MKRKLIQRAFLRLVCILLLAALVGIQQMPVAAMHPIDTVSQPPVEVVDPVEFDRYDGLWYEISSTPSFFNTACFCTTAHYSIQSADTLGVFNACNRFRPRGRLATISGTATLVGEGAEGKLWVTFEEFSVPGDYWIIDVVEDAQDPDGDYLFAAVGGPNRDYIFILARDPILDTQEEVAGYQSVLNELESQFFDISTLKKTPQPFLCEYDGRTP